MKLSLIFGVLNQHELATEALKLAMSNLAHGKETQVIIIDNGSDGEYLEYLQMNIGIGNIADNVGELKIIRNETNVGNYPLFKQALEYAKGDIVAYLHSDLFIYGKGWDEQVLNWFRDENSLGLIGVIGSNEIDNFGGRGMGTVSNFQGLKHGKWQGSVAEIHGARMEEFGRRWAAVVDGCFMAFRKDVLESLEEKKEFGLHHHYDRLMSVQVREKGFRAGTLGVPCDHVSGQTANQEQKWQDTAKEWIVKKYGIMKSEEWIDKNKDWFSNTMNPSRGHIPNNWDHAMYLENEKQFLQEYRDSKRIVPFNV